MSEENSTPKNRLFESPEFLVVITEAIRADREKLAGLVEAVEWDFRLQMTDSRFGDNEVKKILLHSARERFAELIRTTPIGDEK